jgi:hypothetical protein
MLTAGGVRPVYSQTTGVVSMVGGSATDARGVRSNSATVAPGIRIVTGARSAWWLGASGTVYEENAWSAGLNTALSARTSLVGPLSLALDGTASANGTSYDATFLAADATPAVEVNWRSLTVFGGVRASAGSVSIGGEDRGGLLGTLQPLETVKRSSVGPSFGARAIVGRFSARRNASVWMRVDELRSDAVRATDQAVGATATMGPVMLSGTIGRRRSADEALRDEFGHVAALVAVNPAVALQFAAGSYAGDVLTGSARGRFVSAGVRMTVGGGGERPLPQPAGVSAAPPGVTRLSIKAGDAKRVDVYGDWNSWQAQAAQRAANGVWYVDLRLSPGEYRYAFRIDGSEWRVPREAAAVDDGFGGKSAYVSVRNPARTQ